MDGEMNKAYFAAGCFWGVEAAFRKLEGVTATAVGYCGGHSERPSYEDVCGGHTGHAETVEVEYDPARTSFERLLETFWQCHDPTQMNRQGPDVGTQYRSAIFFRDDTQLAAARAAKARLETEGAFDRPIATEISPAAPFWMAEDYHQQYLEKRSHKLFGRF